MKAGVRASSVRPALESGGRAGPDLDLSTGQGPLH